ncbi:MULTISPECIES: PH domain-containing protein [Bacillus]|uniref:YdbS-like PH domain-containing protein n=2 Tax=Bacillus TaxID=1386 RepID=A0A0M4GCC0_9BACI|nr:MULTISPECIES: PH domain-containing protein [Bacillus]ALC83578.1 hypothetical protein AM592_20115 [Bacillus gobiensis]MBP1082571.1 membrane protein YdbS with pleckstrin-like domain [Bacillus capparidis]MED1097199.1 PH domain-containing protein [Bacillus capparidis]
MNYTIPEPQQRISKNAVKVWRISSVISHIITMLIFGALLYCQDRFGWYDWIGHVTWVILILVGLDFVYGVLIRPVFLQRTWRYGVDEEHIQLKHGALEKTHIIVPMTKVQYVNTSQGPLLRKYGLSTIKIGTTASSHEIPAIPEEEAESLRTQIAVLAKITENE